MEIVPLVIVFTIVLLLYIHFLHQYKVSEDLEIYQIDYKTNANLQETCELKQPIIFSRGKTLAIPDLHRFTQLLQLKDTRDYRDDNLMVDSIEMPCNHMFKLLNMDKEGHFFSENNETFIEECGLRKKIAEIDSELMPKHCIQTKYDLFLGSINTCTPLRYHVNTRKYIYVTQKSIKMRMISWKYSKYLQERQDYLNFEFKSDVNVWEESEVMNHVQFIEFDVPCEHIIYIPSFWWYSIQYVELNTVAVEYNYTSLSNKVAFLDRWMKHFLQRQNVTCLTPETTSGEMSQVHSDKVPFGSEPHLLNQSLIK